MIFLNLTHFTVQEILTLPAPCISESFIEIKIKLKFFFTLLCGTSKGLMKAFSSSGIGTGRVKVFFNFTDLSFLRVTERVVLLDIVKNTSVSFNMWCIALFGSIFMI